MTIQTEYVVRYVPKGAAEEQDMVPAEDLGAAGDCAEALRALGYESRVMAREVSSWWDTGA